MKSSLKIYFLIFFFLIFSTYNIKDSKKKSSIFFPIKEISIENNVATNSLQLRSDLNFLMNSSLLFLNKKKIVKIMNNYDFISSIQLKKKYPNTLKILISEKIPLAIQLKNNKKFYIVDDYEKIDFIDLKVYENLPLIFGNYRNFINFYSDLKKYNFKINKIKAFYYFEADRWDIVFSDGKIIKFPAENYLDLLLKINLMLDDNQFSKYKIFDFRIKDQLILK
jgi:cell division septal protein FtsQ